MEQEPQKAEKEATEGGLELCVLVCAVCTVVYTACTRVCMHVHVVRLAFALGNLPLVSLVSSVPLYTCI